MDDFAEAASLIRDLRRISTPPLIPADLGPLPTVIRNDRPQVALPEAGRRMLAAGEVAVATLAGGRSTRFGGRFRGSVPVGPVSGRTLWDLHGERVAAIRARYAPSLPWCVLTSPFVHHEVVQAMSRRDWFGLPRSEVMLFPQRILPVFEADLTPAVGPDGRLIWCPGGHGGVLDAIRDYQVIRWLEARSVRYVFVFQYPNVLEHICDLVMLGAHGDGGRNVTVKAVDGGRRGESVGRVGQSNGRVVVVEYHASRSSALDQRVSQLPMFTGTAVWSVAWLRQCVADGVELPYRVVPHSEPGLDRKLWRFEQWTFDLLPHAASSGVVLGTRANEYAPIKSQGGAESVEGARRALTQRYHSWLRAAGAHGPERVERLEIAPRYALSAAELLDRLPAGFQFDDGLLLDL